MSCLNLQQKVGPEKNVLYLSLNKFCNLSFKQLKNYIQGRKTDTINKHTQHKYLNKRTKQ